MSEESKKEYKLSDQVIAQITRLLQLGILTGTDVTDQFRTLRVVVGENGYVEPSPEFVDYMDSLETSLADAALKDRENNSMLQSSKMVQ